MRDFTGKVALVTGAASGIGKATAIAFARAGAKVVVADVSEPGGVGMVEEIRAAGGEATFVRVDVARAADVERMVAETVKAYGGLDYAHNNAAIDSGLSGIVECSEDVWDRVLAVNLKGVWLGMKHEIPVMLARGGGAIVNTSSTAGLVGFRRMEPYVAAKHGVIGLTKSVALEFGKRNIRVNSVCPGFTRTEMLDQALRERPELEQFFLANAPASRMARTDEVAAVVLWLCSDAAAYVTGATIPIDGGLSAQVWNYPPAE